VLAALVGDVGLEDVGTADIRDESAIGESGEAGDADGGEGLALREPDELRGEAEGREIEAVGPRYVVLLAEGVAEADVEGGGGVEQEGVAPREAEVGTIDNIAALGGDAVKVIGENEEAVALVHAEEGVPGVVETVVEFGDEHVVIAGPLAGEAVVLDPGLGGIGGWTIGRGPEGHDLLGDRVLAIGGDDIAGERGTGGRAVDGGDGVGIVEGLRDFGKVAGAHFSGGDGEGIILAVAFAGAFKAGEPEGLVTAVVELGEPYGATEGEAVGVGAEGGEFAALAAGKVQVGVERGVAEEVVGGAVDGVGAGLDHHVGDAAAGATVFGRERAHLEFELGDGVDGRNPLGDVDAAVHVDGVGGTVDEDVCGCDGGAVGGEEDVGDGVVGAGIFAVSVVHDARCEGEHEEGTAALEGEVIADLGADGGAEGRGVGLEDGDVGDDVDSVGRVAELESYVLAESLSEGERDSFFDGGTKPGRLNG
jgi:hypothetical protein